ncbi:hypothetical protein U1E44_02055 [Arenibacter sp. GZD96]|uniref:hypothetical protein n=1 Tax=Aurantibrevibacter litoralis TaxID=3106030 RepID=UPI002AFE556E|nr:hypothetical protein [Arenibacter sp. GZD-96]MEA1784863.1 hypothetical protein [Arenibacter sp. GZD-96]
MKIKFNGISIVKANIILLLLAVLSVILLIITPKKTVVLPETSSKEVSQAGFFLPKFNLTTTNEITIEKALTLGMFSLDIKENTPLYFYGGVTFGKSVQEHSPIDSLVFFKKPELYGLSVKSAPPWLMAEHFKPDYGFVYFSALTLTNEFIEIEVNAQTGQTFWVSRYAGQLVFWPEFLLSVNSVELIDASQTLKATPFDHASEYQGKYTYLRPQKIKGEWMEVALLDNDFKTIGSAWLKWLDCGEIRVSYSLLS